jgi:hypothetical protein
MLKVKVKIKSFLPWEVLVVEDCAEFAAQGWTFHVMVEGNHEEHYSCPREHCSSDAFEVKLEDLLVLEWPQIVTVYGDDEYRCSETGEVISPSWDEYIPGKIVLAKGAAKFLEPGTILPNGSKVYSDDLPF